MISLKVDVIVAQSTAAALAAKQATRAIPIVFGAVSDPVATGLVASFARPGGNVTGSSFFAPELVGKSMELLTQVVPGVARVAILWQPPAFAEAQGKALLTAAEAAAQTLRVRLQVVEARGPVDLGAAGFVTMPMVEDVPDERIFAELSGMGLDVMDARHLTVVIHNGCDVFLTMDKKVLRCRAEIAARYRTIDVMKPSDLWTRLRDMEGRDGTTR